jgi:hypothetical protein
MGLRVEHGIVLIPRAYLVPFLLSHIQRLAQAWHRVIDIRAQAFLWRHFYIANEVPKPDSFIWSRTELLCQIVIAILESKAILQ